MTVPGIQRALAVRFDNHKYILYNSYIFKNDWECDYYSMSSSGYSYEVEIKLSRSDFRADFKKYKHQIFKNIKKPVFVIPSVTISKHHYGYENVVTMKCNSLGVPVQINRQSPLFAEYCRIQLVESVKLTCPHKFFYAVPEGMVRVEEVPAYAGLIYVNTLGATIIKEAPFLHKNKLNIQGKLLDKFWYECDRLRNILHTRNNQYEKAEH